VTRRPLLAAVAALAATVSAAGCVSMPTGGPVQSYPVTQGTGAQNQPYMQIVPQPPGPGWSPAQIVQGFLTASASFGDYASVAKDYLAPQLGKTWTPSWSAIVYKNGPTVKGPATVPTSPRATATVQITGQPQAYLKQYGSYSVPSGNPDPSPSFQLVRVSGQWRISAAPPELLLTTDSFNNDYQLRNLYFFDPTSKFLIPDPVYVPVQAQLKDLMNGLVHDLNTQPNDWLSHGATRTALPPGTQIRGVMLDGVTAVVNLTGAITKVKAKDQVTVMQQVSAQLVQTLLSGPGQGAPTGQEVKSIEVELDGKPWTPPDSQGNPVQHQSGGAATGATSVFYYVDSAGYLISQDGTQGRPTRVRRIGSGCTAIAVSPDGKYLAALLGDTLYTGPIKGALAKRGSGYVTMSWDGSDDLWASLGSQIVMFRNAAGNRQPLGQQVAVDVVGEGSPNLSAHFKALRVAPDGVRVALVINGNVLTFGAISGRQGPSPEITLSQVQLKPHNDATTFTGLTWYGPDNVITLATPGPVATEYPVSGGGTAVSIAVEDRMQSITASWNNLLVAGLANHQIAYDNSLNGAWTTLAGGGSAPAYPG
jgi:hypothetical protein